MPVFKDYSENAELLQIRDEPLNEKNLARYKKVEGEGKAQGYIEGLEDFVNQLYACLEEEGPFHKEFGQLVIVKSAARVRKGMNDLIKKKNAFLKFAKAVLDENSIDGNSDQNPEFRENAASIRPLDKFPSDFNFKQYIRISGVEKAKGYFEATEDFVKQMESCLVAREVNSERYGVLVLPNTDATIRTKTRALYDEKADFLKFVRPMMDVTGSTNNLDKPSVS
jgi:hypothetical protein